MRRRFRVRRRTFKKRRVFKRRRTFKNARASTKPEIKYIDLVNTDLPMSICDSAAQLNSLGTIAGEGNKAITNLFQYIQIGTGTSQRIGSQIFVKSISLIVTARYCPNSTFQATTEGKAVPASDIMQIRCVWADTLDPTGVDSFLFFHDNGTGGTRWAADMKRLNRREYKFWSDKTYKKNVGAGNFWPYNVTDVFANANQLLPSMTFKQTLPVNKRVIFSQENLPKNEEMVYSLHLFACPSIANNLPSTAKFNELRKQLYCYSYSVRVYYTDV